MAYPDVTLQAVYHDVDVIRRRLAILHRSLDVTTYWPSRLRLRAEIEEAQRDLVAALPHCHEQET